MISLLRGLVPGVWVYIVVAVVAAGLASVGTYKVEHWRSLAVIETLQHAFDQYQLQVATDANASSVKTLQALDRQNSLLSRIQQGLLKQRQLETTRSNLLIERLTNANGKSCPLSPAVVEYLDSVRGQTSSPSN